MNYLIGLRLHVKEMISLNFWLLNYWDRMFIQKKKFNYLFNNSPLTMSMHFSSYLWQQMVYEYLNKPIPILFLFLFHVQQLQRVVIIKVLQKMVKQQCLMVLLIRLSVILIEMKIILNLEFVVNVVSRRSLYQMNIWYLI